MTAFISLVRSVLEYAATIWDPHLSKDINALQGVQRKAARFVKNDYGLLSSVTSMLQYIGWKDLKDRRRDLRLALLYKIIHGHVAVPAETLKLCKPTRQLRANHKHTYQTLPVETTELKSFIVHRTIPEWNILPAYIAEAVTESVASFKSQLAQLEGTSA